MGKKNKKDKDNKIKSSASVSSAIDTKYDCNHKGVQYVMTIGNKCHIFAGGVAEVAREMYEVQPKLLMCVGGPGVYARIPDPVAGYVGTARRLLKNASAATPWEPDAALVVDWPDGKEPPVDMIWWRALVKDLEQIDGNVIVFCHGGHGRTGTALTILAALTKQTGSADPVLWVREHYCAEAVETSSQTVYLNGVGITTTEQPSWLARAPVKSWSTTSVNKTLDALVGPSKELGTCLVCDRPDAPLRQSVDAYLCDDCMKMQGIEDKDIMDVEEEAEFDGRESGSMHNGIGIQWSNESWPGKHK
jgi:hypothetical protein